jgi:hypothetical protein
MVGRLAEAYRPERIYLFGSVARGDAGPDRLRSARGDAGQFEAGTVAEPHGLSGEPGSGCTAGSVGNEVGRVREAIAPSRVAGVHGGTRRANPV